MPFPIGLLYVIDNDIIALKVALHIKSKWGVCPLITHPKAINPSNFLEYLLIATGISKTPGTSITLTFIF